MTQQGLANLTGHNVSTIARFEGSRRGVSEATIVTIRRALEEAGAVFLSEGEAAGGTGVRLRTD